MGVNFAEYNHNLELGKECLCRGLDRLVIHYGGKRTKPQLRGYSDGISLADWLKRERKAMIYAVKEFDGNRSPGKSKGLKGLTVT